MDKNYILFDSPVGIVCIMEENLTLIELSFQSKKPLNAIEKETPFLHKVKLELLEYFEGKRKKFDIPLNPTGTTFQKKVWKALQQIPYGQTRSYGQIAELIGCPKGARAVGMANNKNKIAILIPCHRVIGSNKKLVGYAAGLEVKTNLLQLEGYLPKEDM